MLLRHSRLSIKRYLFLRWFRLIDNIFRKSTQKKSSQNLGFQEMTWNMRGHYSSEINLETPCLSLVRENFNPWNDGKIHEKMLKCMLKLSEEISNHKRNSIMKLWRIHLMKFVKWQASTDFTNNECSSETFCNNKSLKDFICNFLKAYQNIWRNS